MIAYLECYPERDGPAEIVEIAHSPFVIGRSRSASLTIYSKRVSHQHAQISHQAGEHSIRDLGSTNGTFVNGERIDVAPLADGDIIHVAHREFCFNLRPVASSPEWNTPSMTLHCDVKDRESLIKSSGFLREMVMGQSVSILFQRIVELRTGTTVGYEALGRGAHERLDHSPMKLFQLAEKCQMENDLCRLFRMQALKAATFLPAGTRLFLNIHPSEFGRGDFLKSLAELARANANRHPLVIEISERFVTDLQQMRLIKNELDRLSMEFAYDDFGAGQARLLELAECPPRFLKLDQSLVLQMATSAASRDLVRVLLSGLSDKGTEVIAEGIESEHVAQVCRDCGCNLGQGFLYGRPTPALHLVLPVDGFHHRLDPG